MKIMIGFVFGVIVGVAAALLLAPKSGEELRQEMRQEAAAERDRAKREYTHAKEQMQQRVEKVHGDVQGRLTQIKAKGDGETETAVSPE